MRWKMAALAGAVLVTAGGCLFPDSYSAARDPVAVREAGGQLEVLYTSCQPLKIKSVRVVRQPDNPAEPVSEDAPAAWELSFEPPTDLRQFTIGQAPAGATEVVPLRGDLERDKPYAVDLVLEDGLRVGGGFEWQRLAGGKVSLGGDTLTSDDFSRTATCAPS